MVKTYTEWRFAYNDCKFCYDFLDKNEERLKHPFSARSAGQLGLLETPLTALLLISCWIWNSLNEAKVLPEYFLLAFLSVNLLVILAFFIYYPTQYHKLIKYRTKIGIYQSIWPTIIEVINDADMDDYLPEEPEKANFVELPYIVENEKKHEEVIKPQLLLEDKHAVVEEVAKTEEVAEVVENVEDEEEFTIEDLAARWASLYRGNPSTKTRPF